MTPVDMIARRRSVRKYSDIPLGDAIKHNILDYLESIPPLFHSIPVMAEFIDREAAKSSLPMPWMPHDLLAIYSEPSIPARMNIGFLFGILDLYLQSTGLGACWLGASRPREQATKNGLSFLMMMAIGHPDNVPLRSGPGDFDRRTPEEIADIADARLEPARLAPSAINSQPWYFTHSSEGYHIYCALKRSRTLRGLAHIDIGIALGHLAAANPDGFTCFGARILRTMPGHEYMASFRI